jgi:17beta-estradiol 17-dehydrogenase / very-long-chain 3-oxoacyl-CoA reductase
MRMPGTAPEWLFLLLTLVGGVTAAASSLRLLRYLALSLRRPRDLRRRYGAWAVVTGPTSGIGRSVALELARRGLNLVLLDLDAANLERTSDMIRSRHAVMTRTVVFDLSLVGTSQGDTASLSHKYVHAY